MAPGRRAVVWLVALVVGCGASPPEREGGSGAASEPAFEEAGSGPVTSDPLAERILISANAERRERGAPPLTLHPAVSAAAADLASELAAGGGATAASIAARGIDGQWTMRRLASHGYAAQSMVQGLLQGSGPSAAMIDDWVARGPDGFRAVLDPQVRDLGVGVAMVPGTDQRVVAVVATLSMADSFAPSVALLADLETVRGEMLLAVEVERRRAGLPPLRGSAILDRAAQAHAAAMLRTGELSHLATDGSTVADRVSERGYDPARVGENIAQGPRDVDQAMVGWLASPGHRANLLDPNYRELGTGVAYGAVEGGYRIFWVQVFATPR